MSTRHKLLRIEVLGERIVVEGFLVFEQPTQWWGQGWTMSDQREMAPRLREHDELQMTLIATDGTRFTGLAHVRLGGMIVGTLDNPRPVETGVSFQGRGPLTQFAG